MRTLFNVPQNVPVPRYKKKLPGPTLEHIINYWRGFFYWSSVVDYQILLIDSISFIR